jgi:hypothetical protein
LRQEDEGHMPDGHEQCEDQGGDQRRAAGLQAGLGEATPARLLALGLTRFHGPIRVK